MERPKKGFLHVCGGVSITLIDMANDFGFSPRIWRCFSNALAQPRTIKVFSTYVEVFPARQACRSTRLCFLHVCGGVSEIRSFADLFCPFSPRMWRCFWDEVQGDSWLIVFSTYVEVFLRRALMVYARCRFLHVCGGVSEGVCAGVGALGFLHVCGGVSIRATMSTTTDRFSPRMWRCFRTAP